jgi:ABC-type branched-subunit amino acid transport system substrate-binding protein
MKRSHSVTAALAAVAVVGLAACTSSSGGGSSTSTNSGSSAKSSSPAPTFTGEIKIGNISEVSQTSALGNAQPEIGHAIQANIDATNAAGGINGKKIVLDICDAKATANGAAACARQLVKDGVVADVGDATTWGQAVSPIFQAAGIPRIGPLALSAAEYNSPGNYPLNGGAVVMFQGDVLFAAQSGAKSMFIAYTEAEGASSIIGFVQMAYKTHNIQDKGNVGIPPGSPDLSSYVTKAMNSGADVVLTTFGPELTEQFMKTAIQLGAKFRIATVAEAFSDSVIAAVGKSQPIVKNALLTSPFPPTTANDIAGIKKFNDELDAAESQYGDLKAQNRAHIFNSWMASYLFGQIAKSITGDVTAKTVTAALGTAKDVDTLGVMPPWTPSASGGLLHNVSNGTGWFVKVDSNGHQVLANSEPQQILASSSS